MHVQEIHPWKGSVTTWYSRQVGDWEGEGYGAWLHLANPHPGTLFILRSTAASIPLYLQNAGVHSHLLLHMTSHVSVLNRSHGYQALWLCYQRAGHMFPAHAHVMLSFCACRPVCCCCALGIRGGLQTGSAGLPPCLLPLRVRQG